MSNQFVEIKSTVFKKFEKERLVPAYLRRCRRTLSVVANVDHYRISEYS